MDCVQILLISTFQIKINDFDYKQINLQISNSIPIAKMPLLDSNTSKSNNDFLHKISHLYAKRGSSSSMSSYKANQQKMEHTQNLIKRQSQKVQNQWMQVQQQLELIVKPFTQKLKSSLENIVDETKYYKLLSILRNNQFLSEMAGSINQKAKKQNFLMKRQIMELKKTLVHLSKKQREQSKSKQNINPQVSETANDFKVEKDLKIDSFKKVSENIYNQAHNMSQQRFLIWCDKLLMKNKLVITNLKRDSAQNKVLSKTQSFFNAHKRSKSDFYQKQKKKDHPEINFKLTQILKQIRELSPFMQIKAFESSKLQIISQIQTFAMEKVECKNICCNFQKLKSTSGPDTNSLAKALDDMRTQAGGKVVYRDDKMQEYFRRYYKHPDFKVGQITNVQQTKSQQMSRIQSQYFKMLEARSKLRYGYS